MTVRHEYRYGDDVPRGWEFLWNLAARTGGWVRSSGPDGTHLVVVVYDPVDGRDDTYDRYELAGESAIDFLHHKKDILRAGLEIARGFVEELAEGDGRTSTRARAVLREIDRPPSTTEEF